jgi:uncharacterized membrane protein
MGIIFILVLFLLLAGTVLALVAISDFREIRSTLKSFPLNELTFRIYQLEQKVADLQKKLPATTPPIPAATPTVATIAEPHAVSPKEPAHVSEAPPPPPLPPKPTPLGPPASLPHSIPTIANLPKAPSSADLETLIGGRWFNRIGIIALLFAVSYFLKLAFDNNWIGPGGRVAIGIVLGLGMLPWSDWLLSRDYTYFSEGIAGLGEATLFVSVWAGCQYYTLFSREVGFVVLVLVTAIMAYLALRRNSERIAFLSLLGGILTPALMSSGKNEQVLLFSYLLLLGAAALFISWRKDWQSLLPLAFGGTYLYFWQWYEAFYRAYTFLGSTLFFATLIFLLFAVIPASRSVLRHPLRPGDIFLVLANAFAYVAILYALLWTNYRLPLALLFVALAIAHEAIALLLPDPKGEEAEAPRFLYTGVAVTCLTLAIPTEFEHNNITFAFSVEGGALVWTGFRYLGNLLRPFGYFLLALAAFHLLMEPPAARNFLFNERFGTYLILIAVLGVCLWGASLSLNSPSAPSNSSFRVETAQRGTPVRSRTLGETTHTEAALLSVAINFFALVSLTQEFWDYFGNGPGNANNALAQHLSVSVLWTVYAGALLLLGVARQLPIVRWQALILLGIVVVKVFFYDLSFLDRAYRILSFFILGSALLAVSFFYQRKLARDRSSP